MIALALRYWWAVVIAALLAALGVQTLRLGSEQNAFREHLADDAIAKAAATERARQKEQADQAAYDQEAQNARAEKLALEAQLVGLADAGDRLRDQLAEFKRRARAAPSGAAQRGAGKPSPDALDLLADVYARADREAEILGRYADELRRVGATCERSAYAVTR